MSERVSTRVDGGILDVRAPTSGVLDQRPLRALRDAPGHAPPQPDAAGSEPNQRTTAPEGSAGWVAERDPVRHAHLARRPRHDPWVLPAPTVHRSDPFALADTDDVDPAPAGAARPAGAGAVGPLRRRLVVCDLVVLVTAWAAIAALTRGSVLAGGWIAVALQAAAAIAVTVAALHQLRLYRGRVCVDRRVTRRRLLVATGLAPLALTLARRRLGLDVDPLLVALSVAGPWLDLVVVREGFEQWLRSSRLRGRHVRPIVLAGTADEVRQIAHLLDAHPETGFRPVGWIGRPTTRRIGDAGRGDELDRLDHLGDSTEVVPAACRSGATGVLAGPTAAGWPAFPKAARQLQDAGLHVQMWSGLWGISSRRLRPVQLAHEPFFYLERPSSLSRHHWIKRGMDIVIAVAVLVVTSPVLAVAALAVKLSDGGPVFFRQKRVGLHGELFELHKLRTMRVDAEVHLERLRAENERSGPLFKLASDPRVTPVGRALRATSIDELPQLLDVIAGRLSLVGPRPALPSEVAEFDHALLDRHGVLPGLTGLWQAEARHNPSFDAYRHLDLFYVENWTVVLDVLILFATVRTVLADTIRAGTSFAGRLKRRR
jgi:exopolysaccharide biosynthesis polyprenyl glycosylphosphotransferase